MPKILRTGQRAPQILCLAHVHLGVEELAFWRPHFLTLKSMKPQRWCHDCCLLSQLGSKAGARRWITKFLKAAARIKSGLRVLILFDDRTRGRESRKRAQRSRLWMWTRVFVQICVITIF